MPPLCKKPLRLGDEASVIDVGNQPGRGERLEGGFYLSRGTTHVRFGATPPPIPERLYLRLRQCLEPPVGVQEKDLRGLECQQRPPQPVYGHCFVVVRHAASP
jgi:hypothetical protein